jgi:hypothetical protein
MQSAPRIGSRFTAERIGATNQSSPGTVTRRRLPGRLGSVAESREMIPAGKVERGERKRTVDEVSKADYAMSKPGGDPCSGISSGEPEVCPSGIRHVDGAKLNQALVRNVRTCRSNAKGEVQAAPTA